MFNNSYIKLSVIAFLCATAMPVMAAKPVNLRHQSMNYLKSISSVSKVTAKATAGAATGTNLEEVSQTTDMNKTVHTRLKQTYSGYPVWGGDAIIHTPRGGNKSLRTMMASAEADQSTLNGTVYEDLQKDLQNTPAYVFTDSQAKTASIRAITEFEGRVGAKARVKKQRSQLMVYVDDKNQAHWAFYISATVTANGRPAVPTYIMDATDFHIYKSWNNRKTESAADEVKGGGFGGNQKTGRLSYDGLPGSLANLEVTRPAEAHSCLLQNSLAKVTDGRTNEIVSFNCAKPDPQHGNVYWNEGADAINGGFSPNNDALFAAKIITSMYQDWYQIPVLQKDGKPMVLALITHDQEDPENAGWSDEDEIMVFGDGSDDFYPFTSLGITAHEVSHGFTTQHSNLIYDSESGGMNESFSDMADQAAKFYATGKNDWLIGNEIAKEDNFALRYMDTPSKDCQEGGEPGNWCSIDNASQYNPSIDVHFSSGIFNRAYYLLANSKDWDIRKAFDVMVQANSNYWTANSTFVEGACGAIKAADDYKYDTSAVVNAFNQVGVDTSTCA